jgi:hypothetical protein
MQPVRCATNQHEDADRVWDPDVLADQMDGAVAEEGDQDGDAHDDADGAFDG